jgi:outer membrane lipoprotein-sorting protein
MPARRALEVLCAVVFVLCPPGVARSADDELAAALARMDDAGASFKGLSANIRKVSHTAVINEDTVDTGTIYVKRPKPHDLRMRIDVQPPNPKQVEFSGHLASVYYPKSNTVEEFDLGKERAMVDQFLLLGFGSSSKELQNAYTIRLGGPETVAGEKTTRIDLTPKSADVLAHLKKVELWISDAKGVTVQQKFYEPGGDYSLATYTNIKTDANIPDSALKLNLPRDVHRQRPQK